MVVVMLALQQRQYEPGFELVVASDLPNLFTLDVNPPFFRNPLDTSKTMNACALLPTSMLTWAIT